jgi:hypothetical protein
MKKIQLEEENSSCVPHNELLLLRSYINIVTKTKKQKNGLGTCQQIHTKDATILFDKELRGVVEGWGRSFIWKTSMDADFFNY